LDNLGKLPAVSAANLTNFPTFNQSTTGNAATATALSATPVTCGVGQAPTGILVNGNSTGCQVIASTTTFSAKPNTATSIKYVAGTCTGTVPCTDANDGLSWGSAKLTISAAVQSLPGGGGGTAGTGTVYVGPGAVPNAAGNQYGLWFMASADPNFANPPLGWLKCVQGGGACNLNIVGVPNDTSSPNGHEPRVFMNLGSQIVTTTPAIWLSDVSIISFSNMQFQYPGRAFVLGECSTGTRTGTCPVTGANFDNMGALLNQTASNGPCTDITGQSY